MNDLVSNLFDYLFELPKDFCERSYVKQSRAELEKIEQKLRMELPKNKKDILFDYDLAFINVMSNETLEAFRQGIKIGFNLKKEIE